MDKAPDAYRTISEVGEDLDLPQHVLRFWETRFAQIKPLKRGGGRRYYRPDDVELLKGIRHLLYKEGYTIKGVQRILKEQGARAVMAFAQGGLPEPVVADFAPEPPAPHWQPPQTQAVAHPLPHPVAPPVSPPPQALPVFDLPPLEESFQPPEAPAEVEPPPFELTPPPAAPAGQVSMFRGGLHATAPQAAAPQPEAPRLPPAAIVASSYTMPVAPQGQARSLLVQALEELSAIRAMLDHFTGPRPAA